MAKRNDGNPGADRDPFRAARAPEPATSPASDNAQSAKGHRPRRSADDHFATSAPQPVSKPWPYGQPAQREAVPALPTQHPPAGRGTYAGPGFGVEGAAWHSYDASDDPPAPDFGAYNPSNWAATQQGPPGTARPAEPPVRHSGGDAPFRPVRPRPASAGAGLGTSGKAGLVRWLVIFAAALAVVLAVVWALNRIGGSAPGVVASPSGTPQSPGVGEPSVESPSALAPNGMDTLQVGQCIRFVAVPGAAADPVDGSVPVTHELADCQLAEQFKLIVASVTRGGTSCPTADYVKYYQPDASGSGNRLTVCLAPVFELGRCYAPNGIEEWVDTPCADPASYFQIDNVLNGSDPAGCTVPENSLIFPEPEPGRVYCLMAP